jgi:elongation factor 2
MINQDPTDPGTKVFAVVAGIRKRKGLKEGIPPLENFMDKL